MPPHTWTAMFKFASCSLWVYLRESSSITSSSPTSILIGGAARGRAPIQRRCLGIRWVGPLMIESGEVRQHRLREYGIRHDPGRQTGAGEREVGPWGHHGRAKGLSLSVALPSQGRQQREGQPATSGVAR